MEGDDEGGGGALDWFSTWENQRLGATKLNGVQGKTTGGGAPPAPDETSNIRSFSLLPI